MKIQVTEEDILAGVRFSCIACPIAKAVHRAMGNDIVSVGCAEVWLTKYTDVRRSVRAELPPAAKDFIRQFDASKKTGPFPTPFEFDLLLN